VKRRRPTPVAEWQLEKGTPIWPPASDGISEKRAAEVRNVLGSLDDKSENDLPYKAVVEMRVWGRYTFTEIAKELGLNGRQNAHDLYTRGIRWLKEDLNETAE
jgi:DNA-directed RNA polymerase specialized sigma24 family protein